MPVLVWADKRAMSASFKCPDCGKVVREPEAIKACVCPHCRNRWGRPNDVKVNAGPNPKSVRNDGSKVVAILFEDERSITLTHAEREAVIQLARSSSSHEMSPQKILDMIPQEVLVGLMIDGAIEKRYSRLAFTELGETMYHYVSKPARRLTR
jgi:DNA-directed RNA polymerase subunit RPC12/RpoP